jgi:Nuclease-related domain
MSTGIEPRRVAGQHVREQARRRGWLRFLGGRFKRDYSSWAQGAEGEEVVGEILEGILADGWQVIHDVSFGRGNIDHVVVGPGGLFTVETKSRRGRILLDNLDPKMLAQAYGEMKTLETITGMEVRSLLVFSHAYVVDRVPAKRRGVTILPARMLAGFFARQRPKMSVEQADEIYDRLCLAVGQPPSP